MQICMQFELKIWENTNALIFLKISENFQKGQRSNRFSNIHI